MKIMQLTREDIPMVCAGGGWQLVEEVTNELDKAELYNCVIYVRYGPMFLQRMRVDNEILDDPNVRQYLLNEDMWERNLPEHNVRRNNDKT